MVVVVVVVASDCWPLLTTWSCDLLRVGSKDFFFSFKSFEPTLNKSHDHVVDFAARCSLFPEFPPSAGPFQQQQQRPQRQRQRSQQRSQWMSVSPTVSFSISIINILSYYHRYDNHLDHCRTTTTTTNTITTAMTTISTTVPVLGIETAPVCWFFFAY